MPESDGRVTRLEQEGAVLATMEWVDYTDDRDETGWILRIYGDGFGCDPTVKQRLAWPDCVAADQLIALSKRDQPAWEAQNNSMREITRDAATAQAIELTAAAFAEPDGA